MHTLVLNLTRFGDLIQTQPVISGLARKGHEVSLVCLSNFSAAAGLLADVSHVIPFSGARLLARLDSDWKLAVAELHRVRSLALAHGPIQRVVNLTPSLPARLLARVFGPLATPGCEIAGFGVDEFGFNADTSSWAAFLQVGSGNRGASPFNIVDLFCRAAGLGPGPYPFALAGPEQECVARMRRMIRDSLPEEAAHAPLVGVQLGASEDRRRWPVEHFVRAARLFWRESGRAAVLFGAGGESELAERFLAEADFPAMSLVGRTGLDELAGALSCVDLLATNDTGTMHLAAGLGVPVAAVFLATAQPFDTGPYAEGCLCFEPDMDCHPCAFGKPCDMGEACRRSISPETFFRAARTLIEPGAIFSAGGESPGARIWRTKLGQDGLMELESVSGHGRQDRTGWINVQRQLYRRFLDGSEQKTFDGEASLSESFRASLVSTLEEAHGLLHLLGQQGRLLSRGAPAVMQQKFMGNWQKLQDVFDSSSALDVLATLWMFQTQNQGTDMGLLLALVDRYQGLSEVMLESVRERHES